VPEVLAGNMRRRRARAAVLLVAALLALAPPAAIAAAPSGAPVGAPPGAAALTRLSDLRTVSQWAYPLSQALVRATPDADARPVGRLRFLTGDGQAELYVALDSARLASGQTWIQIELPARPNGQRGWVPAGALGALHAVDGYLLVDRSTLRATLFRDGRAVFSAPIGVGKPSTITPRGHFYVMEKLTTLNAPLYGPYAIGTSAYAPTLTEWPGGGVVGIHGTDEPQLIPGRPSHGCVRLRNADIRRLWAIIALGTPIEIT
jgi:hypothetical protein